MIDVGHYITNHWIISSFGVIWAVLYLKNVHGVKDLLSRVLVLFVFLLPLYWFSHGSELIEEEYRQITRQCRYVFLSKYGKALSYAPIDQNFENEFMTDCETRLHMNRLTKKTN